MQLLKYFIEFLILMGLLEIENAPLATKIAETLQIVTNYLYSLKEQDF